MKRMTQVGWFVAGCFVAVCHAMGGQSLARGDELTRYDATEMHMGVQFKIALYSPDEQTANQAFAAAFARIAELNGVLSDYDSASELSQLSAASPTQEPIALSEDLYCVLAASQRLSEQSEGAFDVTVGPLTKLWRRARRREDMPPAEDLAEARAATGYAYLVLDSEAQTALLTQPNMRLDLGGIAKGYAVDEAVAVLAEMGITRALVDGSGDIGIGDPPPGEEGWPIGLATLEPGGEPSRKLLLANCAVATSGDAFQYVEIEGLRYSHIVDPATGLGLTERSSVSILAPDCMTADSLASAVSVLGPERGIELIEEMPGTAALVLTDADDDGVAEEHASAGFGDLPVAEE